MRIEGADSTVRNFFVMNITVSMHPIDEDVYNDFSFEPTPAAAAAGAHEIIFQSQLWSQR